MLIEINGTSYGLHFGARSVELVFEKEGVLNGSSLFNTRLFATVIWAGLQNEAERRDTALSVTYVEVYDFVESKTFTKEGQALLAEIAAAFHNSKALKEVADLKEEVKKKKRGRTSKE